FLNMNRTVCRRAVRRGAFRGAFAATARFNEMLDASRLTGFLETIVQDPAVAGGEIWIALDPAGMPVSMEEKLRGGDKKDQRLPDDRNAAPGRRRSLGRASIEAIFRGRGRCLSRPLPTWARRLVDSNGRCLR